MPRKRPAQPRQPLPAPAPAGRGQCPACWVMRVVDTSGKIAPHQVREQYAGPARLVTCPGAGQQPSGRVIHGAGVARKV